MPLYKVDDLLKLETIGPAPGMPAWAYLRAVSLPACKVDQADLVGPGIYAIFLNDDLFYLGIHAPANEPVTVRWHKHVVAHTLRASRIFMRRRALLYSLTLPGPVGAGLRACLAADTMAKFDVLDAGHERFTPEWRRAMRSLQLQEKSAGVVAPLEIRSFNTIFNKARFAEANWDVVGPGAGDTMLSRITCGFEQYRPNRYMTPHDLKHKSLAPRERDLIGRFRPICNRETGKGCERPGIKWPEIQTAILEAFAAPDPYVPFHDRQPG